ncbi:MAG TPA: hypothetical protein VMC09_06020 [Anaerolineales bacterium]|nr:hypothetical protein [Anaerolineales bacterium]
MVTTTISKMETVWNTFQEPRCAAYLPNSYMLLLSALDEGWKVTKAELAPSWDQHGFIYLVTLQRPASQQTQQLILPKNSLVAKLLHEYGATVQPIHSGVHQPVAAGIS